jgi:hypothetical protein
MKYKTLEGAQRHCHPGYGVRKIASGYETYRVSPRVPEMTHSERLIASLRHHIERRTRALTAIGGRTDYAMLRDAEKAVADLRATMTLDEIRKAGDQ